MTGAQFLLATFRRSPAYPARRIADPRVQRSHSSSDIRISSTREGDSVPGSLVEPRAPDEGGTPRGESAPPGSLDLDLDRPPRGLAEARSADGDRPRNPTGGLGL